MSGTPARLFSGYGHEAQHNQFHGGTIFNDAASGAIWVEHQVSLGAGETICAKEQFEEWLYELSCVEVAQYHSDNGVFTAAEFQEDCKLKHQQQTFSGVGAKHQNGCAERSIQTIMSMACTFMIHVSLHWVEQGSDAVALWPFAVCHTFWLYNHLPNGVTGLSPMEILTGTIWTTGIFFAPMCGDVLCMFLTPSCRMERKFQSGIIRHSKASSLVFQTSTLC